MADNSHVLRAGWQHARSGCAQTAEHRTCPLAPHTGHSPCSSMQWSNRMRPRRRRSRRHRHTASKDAMVTLDVTVLDAMPAEELSRPARKVHASSVGGRRTKGRPGRCSWARATLASATARACLLHAVARPCCGLLASCLVRSVRRRKLSSPVLPRPSCLRASTSAVRVCTERRLGSSEGQAQWAGRRRRCGSGQGWASDLGRFALREFKLTTTGVGLRFRGLARCMSLIRLAVGRPHRMSLIHPHV
jgi:hypothetical protein